MSDRFFFIQLVLMAYFCGAFPSGVIIAKWAKGIDPRLEGSKNPGTTNVARLCGFKYGLITLFLDVFKGFLPVMIGIYVLDNPYYLSLIALMAIFGHLKSIFLNFEGGKGVAILVGALLPIVFFPLLCAAILCVIVIWKSEFVSLGALTMASTLPIFCLLFGYFAYIPLALAIFLIIFWTHRQNIIRLAINEEKVWKKKQFDASAGI